MQKSSRKTYVLAHGSWHGGWCWRSVAGLLTAAGHRVFTPSFTGMGDRAHLLNPDITLDTFIDDLIQVIVSEELSEVILVGHSFAGVPITGVADRIPDRIAQLIYFDAVVLESGESAFSKYPEDEAQARIEAASRATGGLAVPVPARIPPVWGITPDMPEHDWLERRLCPHPLAAYTTPLVLQHPIGNQRPRIYVHCTAPSHPMLEDARKLVQSLPGWEWVEIKAPHEAHITHPQLIADLLLGR